MSGRFETGIRIVIPGRRTESFARGMIGMVAVAAKPMIFGRSNQMNKVSRHAEKSQTRSCEKRTGQGRLKNAIEWHKPWR